MNTQLFVWARRITTNDPRRIISADHTWITNYPNPGPPDGFTLPIAKDKHYWYCWGGFHSGGDKNQNPKPFTEFSGPWSADLEMALCICKSNVEHDGTSAPHARIEGFYGVHGVCHQVANRILWSAGEQPDGGHVTVRGVGGWQWSWFLYGPYGYPLQPWKWPLPDCERRKGLVPEETSFSASSALGQMIETSLGSSFDQAKRNAILTAQEKMLLAKETLNQKVLDKRISSFEFANQVNSLLSETLRAVRGVLSSDDFEKMFGVAPDPELQFQVVDPEMALKFIPPISRSAKR